MLAVALRVIVGKLAVGASGNRNGLRVAHEPDGKVDHMYAEVDQGPAAGLCLGGEPAALAGDSAAADPSAASAVYLACCAALDVLLQVLRVLIITVVSHNHENLAVLLACFLHLLSFLNAYRVGLLAEHMKSVLHCVYGYDGVEVVRGCDIDRVKVFLVDHLAEIRVNGDSVDAETLDRVGAALLDEVAESNDLNTRILGMTGEQMVAAHSAYTDKADSEFLFHI